MRGPLPEGWKTVHLIIRGHVQGVSYRYWMVGEATRRGLNGWVRNRDADGSVEALVSGPTDAVDDLIAGCRQGPKPARVSDIEITPQDGQAEPGFRKLPTV